MGSSWSRCHSHNRPDSQSSEDTRPQPPARRRRRRAGQGDQHSTKAGRRLALAWCSKGPDTPTKLRHTQDPRPESERDTRPQPPARRRRRRAGPESERGRRSRAAKRERAQACPRAEDKYSRPVRTTCGEPRKAIDAQQQKRAPTWRLYMLYSNHHHSHRSPTLGVSKGQAPATAAAQQRDARDGAEAGGTETCGAEAHGTAADGPCPFDTPSVGDR